MMRATWKLEGIWKIVHKDRYGEIISVDEWHNLITDEGQNYMLNAGINGATQITAWYFAPFTNNHTPVATDTYATPGYIEATTEIAEATRQQWVTANSTAQSVTNSTPATITAASAVTIYGIGVVGGGTAASTKGDTAGGGILLASGLISTAKSLGAGETLDMTYTLNSSNA